jgi:hypothetical protein
VLRKAVDQTGRIVAGVKPNQLSGSTPCAEWDTRALLNHTIGAVEMFDDAAHTRPFSASIFANDNVGDDPGASFVRRAAVRVRGHLGHGVPGRTILDWDAAQYAGWLPETLVEQLVARSQ